MDTLQIPDSNICIAYGCVLAILLAGSCITRYLTRVFPDRDYTNLRLRVRTWWLIVPLLIVALSVGPYALAILFTITSGVTLREYLALTRGGDQPVPVLIAAYCAIPVQYLLAYGAGDESFAAFVPLYCLLLAAAVFAAERSAGFWRAAGMLCLGMLLTVFSLSHVVRLGALAKGTGLVVFLLITTQMNDVSQYVWGKMFGRTPLAPTLSPNKTREGMLGGLATSTALAAMLGPLLTPLHGPAAAVSGAALALAGVAGDLTVSALKRGAGVKDAGNLLPGHGGFIDRVDSLLYAAPLFFYGMLAWHGMH
jgi:phosphatidate cytidylyltransferase